MKKLKLKSWNTLLISALVGGVLLVGLLLCPSCKAWRTITTTSSYVNQTDSATNKVTTTIQTKTVEEYQGNKK